MTQFSYYFNPNVTRKSRYITDTSYILIDILNDISMYKQGSYLASIGFLHLITYHFKRIKHHVLRARTLFAVTEDVFSSFVSWWFITLLTYYVKLDYNVKIGLQPYIHISWLLFLYIKYRGKNMCNKCDENFLFCLTEYHAKKIIENR